MFWHSLSNLVIRNICGNPEKHGNHEKSSNLEMGYYFSIAKNTETRKTEKSRETEKCVKAEIPWKMEMITCRFEYNINSPALIPKQNFIQTDTASNVTFRLIESLTMTNWTKADDAKLAALFRKGPHKGISTKDLKPKTIHQIIDQHFADKKYANFAPLFRRKARAFEIDKDLSGSRKKKGKLQQQHFVLLHLRFLLTDLSLLS